MLSFFASAEIRVLVVITIIALFASACGRSNFSSSNTAATNAPAITAEPTQQVFQVRGSIVELMPADSQVRIRHEKIPDYMDAMTMPFDVKSTNELAGLSVGDNVEFRMIVTETDGWIENIRKVTGAATNNVTASAPKTNTRPVVPGLQFVRDVEPLNIGDPLPDYTFTNQLGQAVHLNQFRGQALAFSFIFTRCPFPTFCPLMVNNFRAVQEQLLAQPNGPTNWHLLTISFDPEWDTPERLANYARNMRHDPRSSSFLTGDLVDITALAEQVGLVFTRDADGVGISHNLRTVVVDAQGRVQNIIKENKWTPAELAVEIVKAAGAK